MNILEFATSIGAPLHPAQTFILKLLYGIPLSDKQTIPISDHTRVGSVVMSEKEYLDFLYARNRCNISELIPGKKFNTLALACGRRSGKTYLTSIIVAYEASETLKRDCPQLRYGMLSSQPIFCTLIGNDLNQSRFLLKEVISFMDMTREGMLHKVSSQYDSVSYQSYADMKEHGHRRENPRSPASLQFSARSCYTNSFRGMSSLVVVFDEVAYYPDARKVFDSIAPLASAFSPKDPNDPYRPVGPVEARILMTSTPAPVDTFFKSFFGVSMAPRGVLSLQIPTWEMNPTIPAEEFEKNRLLNPDRFHMEFGAEF